MKPEDEVFLSAYLDGELDAEERSCVESAMLSDPAMLERLRHLAAVNDLVANLPRPALRQDIASSVVRRIRTRRSNPWASRLAAVPRLVVGLSAAALVVLSVTAGLHVGLWARPGHHPAIARAPLAGRLPRPVLPVARPDAPIEPPSILASRSEADLERSRPARIAAGTDRADETELRTERDRSRIRDLLDDPNLTRILIVVDEIGGGARDRVESLVRRAPKTDPNFGRISVAQGITIDPRYPGEATVFAMVVSDDELRKLKGDLTQEFPDSVEDIAAEPAVVTQLSGIGEVAILQGMASDLHAPPAAATPAPLTAMRTTSQTPAGAVTHDVEFPDRPVRMADSVVSPVGSASDAHTDPERELSRPPRQSSGLAAVSPAGGSLPPSPARSTGAARHGDSSIVLVWVTSREHRPGGQPRLNAHPAS